MLQLLATVLCGGLAGAFVSIGIGRYYRKKDEKIQLLLGLMKNRKNKPPSAELAYILNSIDIVFVNKTKIVSAYHDYRDYLLSMQKNDMERNSGFIKLVTEISKELNFKISKEDIDKCIGLEELS